MSWVLTADCLDLTQCETKWLSLKFCFQMSVTTYDFSQSEGIQESSNLTSQHLLGGLIHPMHESNVL